MVEDFENFSKIFGNISLRTLKTFPKNSVNYRGINYVSRKGRSSGIFYLQLKKNYLEFWNVKY